MDVGSPHGGPQNRVSLSKNCYLINRIQLVQIQIQRGVFAPLGHDAGGGVWFSLTFCFLTSLFVLIS